MDHGPTTTAVAAALSRLQAEGRWQSLRQLSAALAALPGGGIKLSHTSIGQIVRGERHVTVDELTALATCLGVSPVTFLMPAADTPAGAVGLSGTGPTGAGTLLAWLRGDAPLDTPGDRHETESFRRRSLPQWAWREES
jgi:hypothetical protein